VIEIPALKESLRSYDEGSMQQTSSMEYVCDANYRPAQPKSLAVAPAGSIIFSENSVYPR
jgi:hypothetical protein